MPLKQALVLLAVAAYLTARTFVAPGVPVLLGGDQGFFWMYGLRMLQGEHVYRDFFQFTPPGADLAFLAAFAAFGARMWVTNAIVVLLGVALGGVCFRVARGIMNDADAALTTALFTVLVYGHPLDATHHWWSALAIMSAVAVLSVESTRLRFAVTGVLLGLAAFCTQTHGAVALVAFVLFAVWDGRRGVSRSEVVARVSYLVAGFALTLLAGFAYFVATAGVGAVLSCVVTYVWRYVRYLPIDASLGLPERLTFTSVRWLAPYLAVYALVVAGNLATAFVLVRQGAALPDPLRRRVTLLWLVGIALLAGILSSLSWIRLFAICAPGIILVVWALAHVRPSRVWRGGAWASLAMLAVLLLRSTYSHHAVLVRLPSGTVATTETNRDKLPWLMERIQPGGVLFAPGRPSMSLQLDVRDPLYLDAIVTGDRTTPEQLERTLHELESMQVRYILWPSSLNEGEPGGDGDTMVAMRAYLRDRYRLARRFADGDEAWERRER